MGCKKRWGEYWREHDPDDVFAYKTGKIVRIRDRRLGFLNLFFIVCVVVYIGFYALVYEKGYLEKSSPTGMVQVSVIDPTPLLSTTTPLFCSPKNNGTECKPECVYYDALSIQYPPLEEKATLITTYLSQYREINVCDRRDPSCEWTEVNGTYSEYYTANAEDMDLQLVHSVSSVDGTIVKSGEEMEGVLQKRTSGDSEDWEDTDDTFPKHTSKIHLPVRRLLDIAFVDLDSLCDKSACERGKLAQCPYETYRRRGVVLLLIISYDNTKSMFETTVRFKIRPVALDINRVEFKTEYSFFLGNYSTKAEGRQERIHVDRHGVRVLVLQEGTLGQFYFVNLLVQLTTSIALLKVSTMIVDFVALRLLPDRKHYREYKFENTEDFSDLRDHIEEEEKKAKAQKERRAKVGRDRDGRIGLAVRKDVDEEMTDVANPLRREKKSQL